jgi:hypothetical protein
MLGDEHGSIGIVNLTQAELDLVASEYQEVNAHLRANLGQFVNWFSFFLTFSFVAVAVFTAFRAGLRGFALTYGIEIVFLLLHILAFAGIVIFRHYITAAHCRVEEITEQLGNAAKSPIPLRFCKWMTDLMAAGFVVSYFTWFALLFVR